MILSLSQYNFLLLQLITIHCGPMVFRVETDQGRGRGGEFN